MHHISNRRFLLCGELIGREQQLRELRESLQRAATGQPQLVLLAGEAGSGKTKLCRVFMEESQAQHSLILFGQAISQDQVLPFGTFLDACRHYFTTLNRTLSPSSHSLHTPLASLLELFPEMAPMFPGSFSFSSKSNNKAVQSKHMIFHGILSALQELADVAPGPLLLVLEDLHWADESSLELLAFLAQRLNVNAAPAPVMESNTSTSLMILGTYRAEALPDNPTLGRLLLQLRIQRKDYEVRLGPLSFSDHRRCLSTILEQPVPEEFARFLFSWDEGNPFFIEELLGAMANSGQLQLSQNARRILPAIRPTLPPSISTAILERFIRLPTVDQEVLSYAAVIGRVFDFPLLAILSGLDEHQLVMVLRRATNAQLISEVSTIQPFISANKEQEHYQFRHALTREAIYTQMLAPERRLCHRTVAETIEKLANDFPTSVGDTTPLLRRDNVAQLLSEHYWLAGLSEKARPYAMHEAERANRVFAFREERYYLHMAQSSLPEDSPERLQLWQRMGMVSMGIYDFAEALHWLSMAKVGYQRIGQPYQALQVMANMLLPNWFLASSSLPDMLAELEAEAETVFAGPHDANRDVNTLVITSLIATYRTYNCQFQSAMHWIEHSMKLYESLTDPRKIAAIQLSLLSRGWMKANQHAAIAEKGIAEVRDVLKAALQYNLPDVILFSYAWLAFLLISWGKSDDAEQVLVEGTAFEQRSGAPRPSFVDGWYHFFLGEHWEQGIEVLRADMKRMAQVNVPALVAIEVPPLVQMLLAKNELDEAEMRLHSIQPVLELQDQYIYLTQMWWGFAKLSVARGDLSRAQEEYERILNRWKSTEDTLLIFPMLLDGIVLYADTGNRVKARRWLAELERAMQKTDNPIGAAALLEAQGTVHVNEGKMELAIHELRQAVEAWGKLKRVYQQALASQRLAEVLLTWASRGAMGRVVRQATREEAERLLDQAFVVYERLQLPTGIEAIQALRVSTHLQAQQKRRHTLETRQPGQGLTQREMQVLIQLAAGNTNKEIATALSISIGTVELHVSHILTKLGCGTRTQAATYAIAKGWVKFHASS
ncbi:MAG: helix-turn-helix transcriptional regulator [Ktedonobacteraceae bacterium]